MNQRVKDQYNSLYAAQAGVFGEGIPLPIVQKITEYLTEGKVLDLGGGEGINALYLAEQGFDVTVYDISEVGIERLHESASAAGFKINTRVVDVTCEPIDGMFDAVINTFVLHHTNTSDAERIIAGAQKHTAKNGVHILSTFADRGGLYDRAARSGRFYPSKETLEELYRDWDIQQLSIRETTTHARDKSGERMKNDVVTVIAVNANDDTYQ